MTHAAARAPIAVIGIGASLRHDDGVGAAAVTALAHTLAPVDHGRVELVVLDGEPTRVIDVWRNRELAVVIDAACAGEPPGSIYRVEVDHDPLPEWSPGASSHSAGLAEAVALGRVLDRLPARLVIFGVEPADLSPGEGLSAEVNDAVEALVAAVGAEVCR